MNEDVVQLAGSTGRKFQELADELNRYAPIMVQGEAQFGILGIISKIETMLSSLIQKKFKANVSFVNEKTPGYIQTVRIQGPKPTIFLKRKFSIDVLKAAKSGDVRPVINSLKDEMYKNVQSVQRGENPYNESYLVIECEAACPASVQSSDSDGTLASFKGVLPVKKLSLVDTDGKENAYVAKEVKKDHFILKPTTEQIRAAVINALYNHGLSEQELSNYLRIARYGRFTILKERMTESANRTYKCFGDKITLSSIDYKRR